MKQSVLLAVTGSLLVTEMVLAVVVMPSSGDNCAGPVRSLEDVLYSFTGGVIIALKDLALWLYSVFRMVA
jgi:hypothetical protein